MGDLYLLSGPFRVVAHGLQAHVLLVLAHSEVARLSALRGGDDVLKLIVTFDVRIACRVFAVARVFFDVHCSIPLFPVLR